MTPSSTIKDIRDGRAWDVPLEARDIVFVLNSPYRFLRNNVDAFGGTQVCISVPVGN